LIFLLWSLFASLTAGAEGLTADRLGVVYNLDDAATGGSAANAAE
jgi:hypothetical protein